MKPLPAVIPSPSHSAAQLPEAQLRHDLLTILLDLDYHAYEQLIRELLSRSGYCDVLMVGRKFKRGRTPSGGHDIKAYSATDLATSLTLTQVKQYRRVVSRRFIDELRGNVLRSGAEQGLLITTSTYSKVAREAASSSDVAPITLLDGEAVLDLLIEHRLGVRVVEESTEEGHQDGLVIDALFFDNWQKKYRSTYDGAASNGASSSGSASSSSLKSSSSTNSSSNPSAGSCRSCCICCAGCDVKASYTSKARCTGNGCRKSCYKTPERETQRACPCVHCSLHTHCSLRPDDNLPAKRAADLGTPGGEMQWRTHIAAGICSLWLLELRPIELFPISMDTSVLPLCLGLAAFGALLPDLDANESKIKHLTVGGVQPFALPAQAISRQFGHRGFFHSASAALLVSLLSLPLGPHFGWSAWAALSLGYASHLATDACTRSGIPLLYVPLLRPDRQRYHLLPFRLRFVTGSEAEAALLPLLVLLVLLLVLRHLPSSAYLDATTQVDATAQSAVRAMQMNEPDHTGDRDGGPKDLPAKAPLTDKALFTDTNTSS